MPDLNFQVTAVEAARRSLTPLLQFKVHITNTPPEELIQAVLLNAQIQIQAPQRAYSRAEQEKLVDLFGPPEDWNRTLRNCLWTHAAGTVGSFRGSIESILPVSCTADLSVTATKYFYALEGGEISLLFLFSGSIFYSNAGRLQVSPISWNKECVFRMPVAVWRDLLQQHYPDTHWLCLSREVFERLYAQKRRLQLITWDETIEHLLRAVEGDREDAPLPSTRGHALV